jgi:hypothetical protein
MNTDQKAKLLLDRFIDQMVLLEKRCPGVVKKPGTVTRRVPDSIIQSLRNLADQADDLLAEMRADEDGE